MTILRQAAINTESANGRTFILPLALFCALLRGNFSGFGTLFCKKIKEIGVFRRKYLLEVPFFMHF